MRRLKMFEGGLLAPQEDEPSVNAAAIASMASRLTAVRRRRRMQRPELEAEPEPDDENWAAARLAAGWTALGHRAASFGATLGRQRANVGTIVQMTMLSTFAVAGSSLLLDWADARATLLQREVAQLIQAAPAARTGADLLQTGLTTAAAALPLQDWANRLPAWPSLTLPSPLAVASRTDPPTVPRDPAPAPHIHEALARPTTVLLPVLHPRVWRPDIHISPPVTVAHIEPRPKVVPHVATAHFELPRWLVEGHPSRETGLVMSEPPHDLAVFHSRSSPPAAPEPTVAKPQPPTAQPAEPRPLPPVVVPPPRYAMAIPYSRPAYGYGYGTPYRQAYGSPYGGYVPPPAPGYPYYPYYQ